MKKSFTLIELMVSISIIFVILSIAVPKYNNHILKSRFDIEAVPTIQAIAMAQEEYKNEFGYYYPYNYINGTDDMNIDDYMTNGKKIEEFLRINLNNTNNFLYGIYSEDGTNYTIRAVLRKSAIWDSSNCDTSNNSTRRCVATTTIQDPWVNNYNTKWSNHYIDYSYPIVNTNANINNINYTKILTAN